MKKVILEKSLTFLVVFLFVFELYYIYVVENTKVEIDEYKDPVDSNIVKQYMLVKETSSNGSKDNPFVVYQNKRYLESFQSFAKASEYARKYENTSIHHYNIKKLIWTNSTDLKHSVLLEAPMISQMPELARGCEVTSLAMMLGHAGVKVDKMTLAKEIKKDTTAYLEKNGRIYYGHPNIGFVGDIYTFEKKGYGVYHKPIKALAEKYLPGRIIDLTGCNWYDLLYFIQAGTPVWVISNGSFKELSDDYFETWNTPHGSIRITMKEHSVLLTGYDRDYIYLNNPLKTQRNQKISREDFYDSWVQMGRQAITYMK